MSSTSGKDTESHATGADLERLREDLQEMEARINSSFAAIERRLEELEWHLDEVLSHFKSEGGPS
ncbi:MAG: hypothetical protein OXG08_13840 [Gammaproteobacteria bacterium]|nr:hypothetical protein [Gammaproteobacteria bacterium]